MKKIVNLRALAAEDRARAAEERAAEAEAHRLRTTTHYEVETGGVKFVVVANQQGWLHQVTPNGEDGGTIFPPFSVLRSLDQEEVEELYREAGS